MQQDFSSILVSLLDIIGYSNDKGVFIKNFRDACLQKAFFKTLESLSEENKEKLRVDSNGKNQEEIAGILKNYIHTEEYEAILEKTTGELFQEYLIAITPSLDAEKNEKLQTYLASVISQ